MKKLYKEAQSIEIKEQVSREYINKFNNYLANSLALNKTIENNKYKCLKNTSKSMDYVYISSQYG